MSEESAEDFLRRGYDELNRAMGDPSGEQLTAFLEEWWHQDAVYVNPPDAPEPGEHRGIEAVRKQIWRWVEPLPDLQIEPQEIRTEGDRDFLWVRFVAHGAGSEMPIEMEVAQVVTVEDGKIRRMEAYTDRAEALAAAGLSECALDEKQLPALTWRSRTFSRGLPGGRTCLQTLAGCGKPPIGSPKDREREGLSQTKAARAAASTSGEEMEKKSRKLLPSPAMIVALAALIVALAGTAMAGGVLSKKKVNNIITSRAPGLSVAQANNADNLGGLAANRYLTHVVVRTNVLPNTSGTNLNEAACNPGERALAGGVTRSDGATGGGDVTSNSFPEAVAGSAVPAPAGTTPVAWHSVMTVSGPTSLTFYVICASH